MRGPETSRRHHAGQRRILQLKTLIHDEFKNRDPFNGERIARGHTHPSYLLYEVIRIPLCMVQTARDLRTESPLSDRAGAAKSHPIPQTQARPSSQLRRYHLYFQNTVLSFPGGIVPSSLSSGRPSDTSVCSPQPYVHRMFSTMCSVCLCNSLATSDVGNHHDGNQLSCRPPKVRK